MQKTYEKNITKNILKWLNALPGCTARKRKATTNNAGQPDITGSQTIKLNSGLEIPIKIEIEVKRPGETPRPNQILAMKRHQESGAICFWCCSVDQCKVLYNEYLERINQSIKG